MNQNDGRQGARSQVDEGSVPPEDAGIAKLEERAQQRRQSRGVRVREAEFVEVVDMGDAKVQRGDEDHMAGRDTRQQVQRDNGRAEHDLLGDGALTNTSVSKSNRNDVRNTYSDVIPPPDPAAQAFRQPTTTEPGAPFTLHDTALEERADEEDNGE